MIYNVNFAKEHTTAARPENKAHKLFEFNEYKWKPHSLGVDTHTYT